MTIAGIHQDFNILLPCGGFEIKGSGVDLAAVNLIGFGPVDPMPGMEGTPDGGIHFAERQPDGSYVIPESRAVVTYATSTRPSAARFGLSLVRQQGQPQQRRPAQLRQAQAAAARPHQAHAGRRSGVGDAGWFHRLTAGNGPPRLVVRITTGELSGPVKLRMRADVLKQRRTSTSTTY